MKVLLLILLVMSLMACATQPRKSVTQKEDQIDAELHSAMGSLDHVIRKKPLSVGSKKISDPALNFYSNMPACEMGPFSLRELMVDEIRVSNSDVSNIASTLNLMGYNVSNLNEAEPHVVNAGQSYDCESLPIVVIQRQLDDHKISNIETTHGFGNESIKGISPLEKLSAAELDRILVYFHPERKREFEKLNWLVTNKLDVPSAQVYIETMVLEVREEDSKEFGLEFSQGKNGRQLSLGALETNTTTLNFVKDTFVDPVSGLKIFTPNIGKRIEIKALIDEGKAEVLSRPSVLAVSNRQAVIQVVDVIQNAELSSTLSESGNLQVNSYNFTPQLIGITLNLKPRVSADRQWVSLEIDAKVESEDDENTGEVYAPTEDGDRVLLADKTGSSSKSVRTLARIPDRTPIIIGGLVGNKKEKRVSKLPILSSLPLIGELFTSMDNEIQKREIIIVITPYVLAEDAIGVASNQPRSSVTSRLSSSMLFDNKYRIKNDDLFDLGFFDGDEYFNAYKNKVFVLVSSKPDLIDAEPFNVFLGNALPGDNHLINKMIYDIVDNNEFDKELRIKNVLLMNESSAESLDEVIDGIAFSKGEELAFILDDSGKGYRYVVGDAIAHEESRAEITLKSKADVERLKKSIVVAEMIERNGGYSGLNLRGMHAGKELEVPVYSKKDTRTLNKVVMEIYNDSESYYQSVLDSVKVAYNAVDAYEKEKAAIDAP